MSQRRINVAATSKRRCYDVVCLQGRSSKKLSGAESEGVQGFRGWIEPPTPTSSPTLPRNFTFMGNFGKI